MTVHSIKWVSSPKGDRKSFPTYAKYHHTTIHCKGVHNYILYLYKFQLNQQEKNWNRKSVHLHVPIARNTPAKLVMPEPDDVLDLENPPHFDPNKWIGKGCAYPAKPEEGSYHCTVITFSKFQTIFGRMHFQMQVPLSKSFSSYSFSNHHLVLFMRRPANVSTNFIPTRIQPTS